MWLPDLKAQGTGDATRRPREAPKSLGKVSQEQPCLQSVGNCLRPYPRYTWILNPAPS